MLIDYKKFEKYKTINIGCDVKEQHSKSDKCYPLLPSKPIRDSFIHSIVICRMGRFLAVLRSFFHSSLLRTFSCHPSAPTILPSSLISSCHLFLGLPFSLVVPKFIYNTLMGILFHFLPLQLGMSFIKLLTNEYSVRWCIWNFPDQI